MCLSYRHTQIQIYEKTRENTKVVSVLQTHTQKYKFMKKGPKNNSCAVFY